VTAVETIAPSLHCIDLNFQDRPGVIAAYVLEDSGERAIVEIGPTSTLDALLAGLQTIDVDPDTIDKLLVTHIHLDHAGAAGAFMRRHPRVQLYVHERGARHMIDPGALVSSATRIYGDMMDTLWGEVVPVSAERVTVLTDGDSVSIGNRRLMAIYTPGHASHHVIFHDPERRTVFAGDVAAVRLQGFDYVRPPTPPPDLDLDLWSESIEKVRALRPKMLYLTHFGPFSDVDRHLDETKSRLYEWGDVVARALEEGRDPQGIRDALQQYADREILASTHSDQALLRYEIATPYGMSADGYVRYFTKRK
jgi:glyoxylase-like metal-dependent hydrolase (beta-lactamase superfamily II)